MGVTTKADELLLSAKENLTDCIVKLKQVLDPDTHGSSEYTDEFLSDLEKGVLDLLRVKRLLSKGI